MSDYYNPYSPTSVSAMQLSEEEMQVNATFIKNYMSANYGWTLSAICGMLGNTQAESLMNPARPQNNAVNNGWYPSAPGYTGNAPNPTTTWYGYGLWQITPYLALSGRRYNPYNYGNWAISNGYTFDHNTGGTGGNMEPQLIWLMSGNPEKNYYNDTEPSSNQRKWYQHSRSPDEASTPAIYGKLTSSPESCAETFYWNFERSGSMDPGNRPALARAWYDYFSGGPTPPDPPDPPRPSGGGQWLWLYSGNNKGWWVK